MLLWRHLIISAIILHFSKTVQIPRDRRNASLLRADSTWLDSSRTTNWSGCSMSRSRSRSRSCGVASGQSRVLVCLLPLLLSLYLLYPCYPGQRNRKCANESFAAVRVSGPNIAQLTRTRANNYKTLAVWALNVLAPPSMTRRKNKNRPQIQQTFAQPL